jgi:hypothetical protein
MIECAFWTMEGVLFGWIFEVIHIDCFARFDKVSFAIDALPYEKVAAIAEEVAQAVVERLEPPSPA